MADELVADDVVADVPDGDAADLGGVDEPAIGGEGSPPVDAGAPAGGAAPAVDEYARILEMAREAGVDLSSKYQDGRSAFEGLLNAQKALSRRDSYADIGRRVADDIDGYEEYLRSKRQPQQPAQPDPNAWELPEPLPQSVLGHLYRDEHGNVMMAQDAPADARRAYERHEQLRRGFAQEFTTNPRAVFGRLQQEFEQSVLGRVEQMIQEREASISQRAAEQSAVGSIAGWLWEHGPDGKPLRTFDPSFNSEVNVLTPRGKQYAQEVQGLLNQGLPSTTAHELALRLIGGPPAPANGSAPTNGHPAPVRRQQRAAAPPSADEPQSLFEIAMAAGEITADD